MVEIDMSRFLQTFFEESAEHIERMESSLLDLEAGNEDPELLNGIFRGAHSIKGASGMFNFNDILHFTHAMESLLDKMRDGTIKPTRELTDVLLRATDNLEGLIAAAKVNGPPPEGTEPLRLEIEAALGSGGKVDASAAKETAKKASSKTVYDVTFAPGVNVFLEGMDPMLMMRDLARLGAVEQLDADLSLLPKLEDLDPEKCLIRWRARLETEKNPDAIRDVFSFVSDSSVIEVKAVEAKQKAQPEAGQVSAAQSTEVKQSAPAGAPVPSVGEKKDVHEAKAASKAESSTIRVPVEKVDKLINLAGEIVIAQSMITQVVRDFTPERLIALQEAVTEMERNTRDLQEQVMAVRMVPVGSIWARFPRVVRDLASGLGKQITLSLSGEETELDKTVIEKIGDPLMHLLRNSVDHGIEKPEDRLATGKPAEGHVKLSAMHQGGNVLIDITDDGRGLNTERIREKGIEKGLIQPGDQLSDSEIHQLIFAPGFSTAEKLTDISGRGVGMDVVKRNVEELNGSISIDTTQGKGTRFRIKLPLTLAVLDGLSLAVGDDVFLMPLLSIVESLRPRPEDIRTVCRTGEVMILRGETVPLLRLHKLFNVQPKITDPSHGVVVVIDDEGERIGLMVDELLGQSQVVIKNLEANFKRVEGVMGATILGDGRVALILDVQGLVRLSTKERAALKEARSERPEPVAVS